MIDVAFLPDLSNRCRICLCYTRGQCVLASGRARDQEGCRHVGFRAFARRCPAGDVQRCSYETKRGGLARRQRDRQDVGDVPRFAFAP